MIHPVPITAIVTQTFAQHVARAKANGWCSAPGNCPGGVYYYGGIDYAVAVGTPILAALGGTVTVARKDAAGYGTHVRIQNGTKLFVYGHLSEIRVQVGQQVSEGEIIGLSGNTGFSTGPHLHFEVRENGVPVDPDTLYITTEPLGDYIVTTASLLNVRLGPGLAHKSIAKVPAGTIFERVGESGDWVKVAVYVHKDYVT